MNRGVATELEELKERAAGFAYGPAKTALLEEAVRRADAAGDTDEGYTCRQLLMEAGSFGGRGDLLLVHFPWCLEQFDRDPDRFNAHRLLWQYKWVCGRVLAFPEIPLAQIESLLDDMDVRFTRYGAGARAAFMQRYRLTKHRGDRKTAGAMLRKFRAAPRDELSDCRACEVQLGVAHHLFAGRPVQAIAEAAPLTAGHLSCQTVPRNTYASLLVPLVKLGRTDDAAAYYRSGLRFLRSTHPTPWVVGEYVTFLALTGNADRAVTLAGRHFADALDSPEQADQFSFALAVRFLADRLTADRDTVRLRLPDRHPLAGRGPVAVRDLASWALGWAESIADRFDRRNGTDAFRRQIQQFAKLVRYARPVELG